VLALRALPAATNPQARRSQLVDRMRSVFGQSFVVLPMFRCTASARLNAELAASEQRQGGDALAANTWFSRHARVRDGLYQPPLTMIDGNPLAGSN
jgi:hypothetical protein